MKAIKLLIDRNVQYLAVRAEGAAQESNIQWGELSLTDEIYGYRGKALPHEEWKRYQIEALPTIARLTREGKLVFCVSPELHHEAFNASRGWQGKAGDIFRGIEYQHVPSAVERSYFWKTLDFGEYISGDALAKWYKEFLLKVDEKTFLPKILQYIDLPEFDRRNMANLARYRELCQFLKTDDHIRDAFHLWTAETNDLDNFLTADKGFINVMTKSTPLNFPTPPISPVALLDKLGVVELDPLPLADGKFRHLLEDL